MTDKSEEVAEAALEPSSETVQAECGNEQTEEPAPQGRSLQICEICRISCVSSLAYKMHLKGQKHKRKAEAVKAGTHVGDPSLYCKLCNVSCTCIDSYQSHLVGAKHKKILELEKKVGKFTDATNGEGSAQGSSQQSGESTSQGVWYQEGSWPSNFNGNYSGGYDDPHDDYRGGGHVQESQYSGYWQRGDFAGHQGYQGPWRPMYNEYGNRDRSRRFRYNARRPPYSVVMPAMRPLRSFRLKDDYYILKKHRQIYPSKDELEAIQAMVSNVESALKNISGLTEDGDSKDVEGEISPSVAIKGVVRVGNLAKGLLLRGDTNMELVVMVDVKPMESLLSCLCHRLERHLKSLYPEEAYLVQEVVEDACLVVIRAQAGEEEGISVTVSLTSTTMRQKKAANQTPQPAGTVTTSVPVAVDLPGILCYKKCNEALASVRHTMWFQEKASGIFNCQMLLRILRDICRRVTAFAPVSGWAAELIVEKVLSSAVYPLALGAAMRRIFEALAWGILLEPNGGLMDPCEKYPVDVLEYLTQQQKDDITAFAQNAMRLIAFNSIHKLLDMERIPHPRERFARKRVRENEAKDSTEAEALEEGGTEKKEKKDGEEEAMAEGADDIS